MANNQIRKAANTTFSAAANAVTLWPLGGAVVMAYLGGRLSEVSDFPLAWRVAFYVFAALFCLCVGANAIRLTQEWRRRRSLAEETGVPAGGPQFITFSGGTNTENVINAVMSTGGGPDPLAPASVPVATSPDDLARLADALDALASNMNQLLNDTEVAAPALEPGPGFREAIGKRNQLTDEALRRLRTEFAARALYLLQAAAQRGFEVRSVAFSLRTLQPMTLRQLPMEVGALGIHVRSFATTAKPSAVESGADEVAASEEPEL